MKRSVGLVAALFLLLNTTACASQGITHIEETSEYDDNGSGHNNIFSGFIRTTASEEPFDSTTETETPIPETEAPAEFHSELYIQGISVEEMIIYFNEVCLDSELSEGGDDSLVQKWCTPLEYKVHGDYTSEDIRILHELSGQLNDIEGFPGIYPAEEGMPNLNIYFCDQDELNDRMGTIATTDVLDGAVTFWFNENNEIIESIICIRSDLGQHLRNSVILEEMYNGLGPIQDTALRSDSVIYQEFATPQYMTETDLVLLKLLYDPRIRCGMDAADCEEIIRHLYY